MRACGVGISALTIPVLAIGALVSASTGYLMLNSEHLARKEIRTLLTTVAARGNILRPGSFRTVGGRVIFIRGRDRHNNLRGIMISAETGEERPYVIFAEQGRFEFDPEQEMVRILLSSGDLHIEPDLSDPESYQHITFQSLSYEIDIQSLMASGRRPTRPKQMTLAELRDVSARADEGDPLWGLDDHNPINYELEIHRRFALPFAPLIFAVLAVAVGSSRPKRSRSWALLLGILLAFAYYASIAFGTLMAEKAWIPPALAPWGPTALFAILGLVLLQRTRSRPTP
jgi:lipopolysaccharide export system permease protein